MRLGHIFFHKMQYTPLFFLTNLACCSIIIVFQNRLNGLNRSNSSNSSNSYTLFGDHSEKDTPVPIPNTEVKLLRADGTARETWWESRPSPIPSLTKNPLPARKGFFYALFQGRERRDSFSGVLPLPFSASSFVLSAFGGYFLNYDASRDSQIRLPA